MNHPNRIIVAKIHSNFLAEPYKTTEPDFRIQEAQDIAVALGEPGKPFFAVDRKQTGTVNPLLFSLSNVASGINSQVTSKTIVNIDLEKQWNASKDTLMFAANFTFTDTTSADLMYSIYMLENHLEATQDSNTIKVEHYIHHEVLRKCITPTFIGAPLPIGFKEKARVYHKALIIPKPENLWVASNGVMVVFIHDKNTKEVLQVQELQL